MIFFVKIPSEIGKHAELQKAIRREQQRRIADSAVAREVANLSQARDHVFVMLMPFPSV
jgi:hypothetical protein